MRKFLVVLDDSRECLNAMRYAALRAAHTGAGVQILSIIPPEEFRHWLGVADLMRADALQAIYGLPMEVLTRADGQLITVPA